MIAEGYEGMVVIDESGLVKTLLFLFFFLNYDRVYGKLINRVVESVGPSTL